MKLKRLFIFICYLMIYVPSVHFLWCINDKYRIVGTLGIVSLTLTISLLSVMLIDVWIER